MKVFKNTLFLALISLALGAVFSLHPAKAASYSKDSNPSPYEQNLHDTLLTLLTPTLDKAVEKIYGEPKQYDLFNAKVEQIKRPDNGGFHFIITVTVQTFEGAHSPPYGRDRLIFDVTPEKTTLLKSHHEDIQANL